MKWLRLLGPVSLCLAAVLPAAPVTATTPPSPLVWTAMNHGLTPHFQVTAIVADPNDPAHLFAALYAPTALLESEDGGRSWAPAAFVMPPQHPITTLLFHPEQPAQLLLGGPDGLFQIRLDYSPPAAPLLLRPLTGWPLGLGVFTLAAGPDGTLYAATPTLYGAAPALWFSRDGRMWRALPPLPAAPDIALLSVLATPTHLLVGTAGAGLFRLAYGAAVWQSAAAIGETFVAALWAAPWDAQRLLARTRAGLFWSDDGGAKWERSELPGAARVDSIAAFAGQTILLGMSDGSLLRSFDAGVSWQVWGSSLGRDGLFYTLTVVPNTTVNLLAGTQHGLYRSVDGGLTWQRVTLRGAPVTFFQTQALVESGDGALYLGSADGVYRSQNQGGGWRWASTALPVKAVLALTTGGAAGTTLFAGSEGGVYRLAQGDAHWRFLGWTGAAPGLVASPAAPNRLYLRAAYERVYTTDEAASDTPDVVAWEQRGQGMALTSEILSLAIDPTNAQILYAGGATELFKSTDGAQQWRAIGQALAGQSVFALLVDPQTPQTIYAGATNGLYQSTDGGNAWQPLGDALTDRTVSALAQHPATPDLLAAGTKFQGLWLSHDRGRTWVQSGVPAGATVYAVHFAADGQWLFAATDHGFWRAALTGAKP